MGKIKKLLRKWKNRIIAVLICFTAIASVIITIISKNHIIDSMDNVVYINALDIFVLLINVLTVIYSFSIAKIMWKLGVRFTDNEEDNNED